MNQTKYRNWVQNSFLPLVMLAVPSQSMFSARELTKLLREESADGKLREIIKDTQTEYNRALGKHDPLTPRHHRWFFYEFGDRVTRALNTVVGLELMKTKVRSKSTVNRYDGTHTRTILEYQFAWAE